MNTITRTTTVGKSLPTSLVTWFEKRGFTVDATTGKATRRPTVEFVLAPEPTAQDLYWQGFMAYCNTNCVATDLVTIHERRGWWAALEAHAAA